MDSCSSHYIEVDYPSRRWYFSLIWFYVLLPNIVLPISLWVLDRFSVLSWIGLFFFLQLLWSRRLVKDLRVPYAVLVEEERVVVYTRVGKRIKENPIDIKDLATEYNIRKNSRISLGLWIPEENRYPSQIFILTKEINWSKDKIDEVVDALSSISHYSVRYKER